MLIRYPDWNCNLHRVDKMGFSSICRVNPGRPVKSKKSDFTAKDSYVLISLFIREPLNTELLNGYYFPIVRNSGLAAYTAY